MSDVQEGFPGEGVPDGPVLLEDVGERLAAREETRHLGQDPETQGAAVVADGRV